MDRKSRSDKTAFDAAMACGKLDGGIAHEVMQEVETLPERHPAAPTLRR